MTDIPHEWPEDEWVILSALNQFVFCPRRCFLVNAEGVFFDNLYTLQGTQIHETADLPGITKRKDIRIVRALPLFSDRWGIQGKADVVEFHRTADGKEIPYPIEYKRGPKKRWQNDDIQLCAQALCLEEMFGVDTPEGAVYHAQSQHRRVVLFTMELRAQTLAAVEKVRALLKSREIPPPVLHARCEGCSVHSACLPEINSHAESVQFSKTFQVES